MERVRIRSGRQRRKRWKESESGVVDKEGRDGKSQNPRRVYKEEEMERVRSGEVKQRRKRWKGQNQGVVDKEERWKDSESVSGRQRRKRWKESESGVVDKEGRDGKSQNQEW